MRYIKDLEELACASFLVESRWHGMQFEFKSVVKCVQLANPGPLPHDFFYC